MEAVSRRVGGPDLPHDAILVGKERERLELASLDFDGCCAQGRGIGPLELQVDGGTWHDAQASEQLLLLLPPAPAYQRHNAGKTVCKCTGGVRATPYERAQAKHVQHNIVVHRRNCVQHDVDVHRRNACVRT